MTRSWDQSMNRIDEGSTTVQRATIFESASI
jgi:hypothetical protein